jgi:GTP-binding protein
VAAVTASKTDPFKIADARFVAAGSKLADLPPTGGIEIGFAGRSNVGKSSLLNSLVQRRALVRTSKTPGATRPNNLFELTLAGRAAGAPKLVFADLPGYGYAQRSRAERASWGPMLEGYLESRPELVALVILVDARRGLEEDDVALAQFASSLERPLRIVVCVTKLD